MAGEKSREGLKFSSARKSLLLFTSSMGNSLLGFISTIIVARRMGPEVLGIIGYLLGLTGLIALFSDLGFSMAHRKRASERNDIGDLIGTYGLISLILSLAIAACVITVPWIGKYAGISLFSSSEQRTAYYIISAILVLNVLSRPMTVTFEARQELAKSSVCSSLSSFVSAVAKIVVAWANLGLIELAIAFLLESATLLVTAIFFFRNYPVRWPVQSQFLDYARYASPVAVNSVLASIYSNADRVILRTYAGEVQVGYYISVLGIIDGMGKITGAAMAAFFPRTSRDAVSGDLKRIRERLFAAQKYLLLVTIPIVVMVVCFSSLIVLLTLGKQFLGAVPVLSILAVGTLLTAIIQPYSLTIYAIEKHASLIYVNLISTGVMLATDLILVPAQLFGIRMFGLGATGAAIGVLSSYLVSGTLQIWITRQHTGIGFWSPMIWYWLAGMAMYITIRLIQSLSGGSLWIALTLGNGLGIIAFWGLLTLLKQVTWDDVMFFVDVFNPRKMVSYAISELKR